MAKGWHDRAPGHGVTVPTCWLLRPNLVTMHGWIWLSVWSESWIKGNFLALIKHGKECGKG